METIQEFYEFFEDIHNSAQCHDKKCSFKVFIDSLKGVFDLQADYYFIVNLLIRQSIKHFCAFGGMFRLQKLEKEKVKNFIVRIEEKQPWLWIMAIALHNPVSDDFHVKLCNTTTLDEQIDVCINNVCEFLSIVEKFHCLQL